MAKVNKDLRGKKFVLDRYGNPVIIGKVNPETLPTLSTPLQMRVKTAEDKLPVRPNSPARDNALKEDSVDNNNKNGKKKQFIRVAGSRGVESDSFKPTLSLATTLSGVESIPKVNPGVIVRSKATAKSGEVITEDPKHMSRKTYMSKTLHVMPSATLSSSQSILSETESRLVGGSTTGKPNKQSKVAVSSNDLDVGFADSPLAKNLLENLPEVNALEGGRVIIQKDDRYDITDAELGIGPKSSQQNSDNIDRAKLPQKASEKQEQNLNLLRGSPENGKPKDREFPRNVHPVATRKHLPAPALGQTTGHGLNIDKAVMEKVKEPGLNNSVDSASWSSSEWHQQQRN